MKKLSPRLGSSASLVLLSLSLFACAEPGTENWPAVEDAVGIMLVEFHASRDAEGRSPFMSATWETGQQGRGDSIPRGLLDRLSAETGVLFYSEDLALPREETGILTIFEPKQFAPDTLGILATWVFREAEGGWHGLQCDLSYQCSRFGCKRHGDALCGPLN